MVFPLRVKAPKIFMPALDHPSSESIRRRIYVYHIVYPKPYFVAATWAPWKWDKEEGEKLRIIGQQTTPIDKLWSITMEFQRKQWAFKIVFPVWETNACLVCRENKAKAKEIWKCQGSTKTHEENLLWGSILAKRIKSPVETLTSWSNSDH